MIKIINKIRNRIAVFLLLSIGGLSAPILTLTPGSYKYNESEIQLDNSILCYPELQEFLDKRSNSANIISTLSHRLQVFFGDQDKLKSFNPIQLVRSELTHKMNLLEKFRILEMSITIAPMGMKANSTRDYMKKLAEHCTLREILNFMINGQDVKIYSLSGNEITHHLRFSWYAPESVVPQLARASAQHSVLNVPCRYVFNWQDGMPQMNCIVICPPKLIFVEQTIGERTVRFCQLDCFKFGSHAANEAGNKRNKGVVLSGHIDLEDKDVTVEFIKKDEISEVDSDLISLAGLDVGSKYYLGLTKVGGGTIIFRTEDFLGDPEKEIENLRKVIIDVPSALRYLLRRINWHYEIDLM